MSFRLVSDYQPSGDQNQAIEKIVRSFQASNQHQTLLGVTGSGKTFTMANIVNRLNRPTLVMSHNKTLAAQLYSEFKKFFPDNAVEYFVSYFDYYQPEAYIARTDTYIEKDSSINDEIERLRLSTMGSLLSRKDVLVVASVSCIYGLGSPEEYEEMMIPVWQGQELDRDNFLKQLVGMMFERNDVEFGRGKFRVRGDVVEIHPAYLSETAIRVEFFGDEIERISSIETLTGTVIEKIDRYTFFPAKQFVTSREKLKIAIRAIRDEARERIAWFESKDKLIEAQRLKMRTDYDIEMMEEMGFCQGIENYSRHITGREPGERPYTLLDFFPDNYLSFIDESHVTIPQIRGMYKGDRSRKTVLVDHGFRLPSAMDNRPLQFNEFFEMTGQRLYVSATPGAFEVINSRPDNKHFIPTHGDESRGIEPVRLRNIRYKTSTSEESIKDFDTTSKGAFLIVEQIIRPTGLLDPILRMFPLKGQIDKTIELCGQRVALNQRVLITTLTKKTAENLTEYLQNVGLKVRYIHADVDTIERVEIMRQLRAAEFDILVGINLLREGLDLPEVSLVCILDADKEGFLRNETSLVQTAGRAARHIHGECVLFCDTITESIQRLLDLTKKRRSQQMAYNEMHGIEPKSTTRTVQESLHAPESTRNEKKISPSSMVAEDEFIYNAVEVIRQLEGEMQQAASKLDFEKAAHLRDQIQELKKRSGIESKSTPINPA